MQQIFTLLTTVLVLLGNVAAAQENNADDTTQNDELAIETTEPPLAVPIVIVETPIDDFEFLVVAVPRNLQTLVDAVCEEFEINVCDQAKAIVEKSVLAQVTAAAKAGEVMQQQYFDAVSEQLARELNEILE